MDICKEVCPCNQCDTEPEDCELAKAYEKLQQVRKAVFRIEKTIDDN